MPVDAVVTSVDSSSNKPLRVRRIPLERLRKRLEPRELFARKFRPESFGISSGAIIEISIGVHAPDLGARNKLGIRRICFRFAHEKLAKPLDHRFSTGRGLPGFALQRPVYRRPDNTPQHLRRCTIGRYESGAIADLCRIRIGRSRCCCSASRQDESTAGTVTGRRHLARQEHHRLLSVGYLPDPKRSGDPGALAPRPASLGESFS
jgi:hypothetical protein